MRTLAAIVLAAALGASAVASSPEQIVYARVSPNPGGLGLFIAAADGSGERALLNAPDLDYDAAFAPDGQTLVFTSERNGSADLYRVKADGSALERLTDDPAYDDQAAFAPDGRQVVFVSTRQGGFARLWILDLATRRAKRLTAESPGDFRPSWSPDGSWIAFSSARGSSLPFAYGRWERLQQADIYIVHPDGSGLKRVSEHGNFCGSPKWAADSRHVIAYCMTAEQTLSNRRAFPESGPGGNDTRLVSFDISRGTSEEVKTGAGVMFNPSFVGGTVGYIRKFAAGSEAGIYYLDGRSGPKGDIRSASWTPDGTRVVYIKGQQPNESMWWQKADGTAAEEQLVAIARAPESWLARDQLLSFITLKAGATLDYDIWTYSTRDKKASVLIEAPVSAEHSSRFSPDGRWIAYVSNEGGEYDVYVQPYPLTGAKYKISSGGGLHPEWAPDGKQLYFDNAQRLYTVQLRTEPSFEAAAPVLTKIAGFIAGAVNTRRQYDLTPDGKQFLMMFLKQEIRIEPKWGDQVRARVK